MSDLAENFHVWRGRVEMTIARRLEADGMAYWTGRDVAMGIVEKAKGLRAMQRKGLAPTAVAAKIMDRTEDEMRGAYPAGARVALPPGTTRG